MYEKRLAEQQGPTQGTMWKTKITRAGTTERAVPRFYHPHLPISQQSRSGEVCC